MKQTIDLRSDTVTQPTQAMRAAMAAAIVGDDVFGDDPTVKQLEESAASMVGKEAALFVCSGTQSNLLALMSHCQRGDEYIVGQQAHTYRYEGGGAAVLGSIQPQPLEFDLDGTLDLNRVHQAIKPLDPHFARTRLLCQENTQSGKVLPMAYLARAAQFCQQYKLAHHLDGARLFNAAVKLNIPARNIVQHFDSVSICLSKGLGAPIGSLLCGSQTLIDSARRWRKLLGGGWRQAGVLAAAGLMALQQDSVQMLAQDHSNAKRLAIALSEIEEIKVNPSQTETNMVFVTLPSTLLEALYHHLSEQGITIVKATDMRLVTHRDVSIKNIETTINSFKQFFSKR